MSKTAYWEHHSSDAGNAVKCSSCQHKMSVLDFLIADVDLNTCPWCSSPMKFERLNYDRLLREASDND